MDSAVDRSADRIEADLRTSRYVDQKHLVVLVNGEPLDELLAASQGVGSLQGLVTTLDENLVDHDDRRLAWQRILPDIGETSLAPVLVCPDDLDFDCITVMAEVCRTETEVTWSRLGIDRSEWGDEVGASVDRFLFNSPVFEFSTKDYQDFLVEARQLASEWWDQPGTDAHL